MSNKFTQAQADELRRFWDGDSSGSPEPELEPDQDQDQDDVYLEDVDAEFEDDDDTEETPDDLDLEEYFARGNPSVPVIGISSVVLAAGGWIAWRYQQRRKLVTLLKGDPRTSGYPAPESIAANEITFTNTATARAVFEKYAGGPPGLVTEVLAVLPDRFSASVESVREAAVDAANQVHQTSNTVGETKDSITGTIKSWIGW